MVKLGKNILIPVAIYAALVTSVYADDVTRSFDISGFTKIELNTSTDLKVEVGPDYSITMTGDEDRIEKMEFDLSGDELEISSGRNRSFFGFGRNDHGHVDIFITMPDIKAMSIHGSGDAEITGVDNDEISLEIHGSGDLYVSGRSKEVDIEIHGSGDIEMDEVSGNNVTIEIEGSGNVEFDGGTCNYLEIEIDGSGDVDAKDLICREVSVDVSGSGNSRVHATEKLTFDSNGSGKVDVFGKPSEVIDHTARRNSSIRIR